MVYRWWNINSTVQQCLCTVQAAALLCLTIRTLFQEDDAVPNGNDTQLPSHEHETNRSTIKNETNATAYRQTIQLRWSVTVLDKTVLYSGGHRT
jgi:hypothetical protein